MDDIPSSLLHFRAATLADQPEIAALTRDIWGGEDYLAKVWVEWVKAPNGRLRVGELDEQIAVVGRLVELAPGEWWLEGLRVHPALQGRGLATPLHAHLVALAQAQPGARTLGLTTAAENRKVTHLAEASGMRRRSTQRFLKAPALADPVAGVEPWAGDEDQLAARLAAGPWLGASEGFVMHGWVTRRFSLEWLREVVAAGGAWQCGAALALTGGDGHGSRGWLYALDGGTEAEQQALVRQARFLASTFSGDTAFLRAFVPEGSTLEGPLLLAGMADPYEAGPFHVYHFEMEL